MEYKRLGEKIIVRLDKGEDVIESIKSVCMREKVGAGSVLGIGALKNIELRYFDPETKKYHDWRLGDASYEAAPLAGNVSFLNGETYLHLHASVSGPDFKAWAGHLKSAMVSATFEVVIGLAEGKIERKFSEEIGLNLLDFK